MAKNKKALTDWADGIFDSFIRSGVRQVAYVPDAGHARLISLCERSSELRAVPLTTEEEGVAMLAGAWLGGQRGALLMQSSGVGNCINMFSLIQECRFPLFSLVTMRGEFGEFNPWQVPMGRATQPVLEAMGVLVSRADRADDVVPLAEGALRIAYNTLRPAALLIGQQLLGAKTFRD